MAEGDGAIYNSFKLALGKKEHDLESDELKVMLVSGYTPDIDSDSVLADVSGLEVNDSSASGYTAGGEALSPDSSGQQWTQDNTNDRAVLKSGYTLWSGLFVPETPSHAILYNNTHASKALIGYWEVTTPTNGSDYELQYHADGVMDLT